MKVQSGAYSKMTFLPCHLLPQQMICIGANLRTIGPRFLLPRGATAKAFEGGIGLGPSSISIPHSHWQHFLSTISFHPTESDPEQGDYDCIKLAGIVDVGPLLCWVIRKCVGCPNKKTSTFNLILCSKSSDGLRSALESLIGIVIGQCECRLYCTIKWKHSNGETVKVRLNSDDDYKALLTKLGQKVPGFNFHGQLHYRAEDGTTDMISIQDDEGWYIFLDEHALNNNLRIETKVIEDAQPNEDHSAEDSDTDSSDGANMREKNATDSSGSPNSELEKPNAEVVAEQIRKLQKTNDNNLVELLDKMRNGGFTGKKADELKSVCEKLAADHAKSAEAFQKIKENLHNPDVQYEIHGFHQAVMQLKEKIEDALDECLELQFGGVPGARGRLVFNADEAEGGATIADRMQTQYAGGSRPHNQHLNLEFSARKSKGHVTVVSNLMRTNAPAVLDANGNSNVSQTLEYVMRRMNNL